MDDQEIGQAVYNYVYTHLYSLVLIKSFKDL